MTVRSTTVLTPAQAQGGLTAPGFDRFAGAGAILAGAVGLLYAISFVLISRSVPALGGLLSALFLLLGGIASIAALVGLYRWAREVDDGYATLGLLLALAGALRVLVHGGYDLANALHPPAMLNADLPSPIDPRGLLTFGLAGLGALINSALIVRSGRFPRALGQLGYLLGGLLVIVYLGRLIVLDAASPLVLGPAALTGFLVNPIWYAWLGLSLWRGAREVAEGPAS